MQTIPYILTVFSTLRKSPTDFSLLEMETQNLLWDLSRRGYTQKKEKVQSKHIYHVLTGGQLIFCLNFDILLNLVKTAFEC